MKILLTALTALLCVQSTLAQTPLSTKEEVAKHSQTVVVLLRNNEFQQAFTELKKCWPLPQNELEQLESQTVRQFNIVGDRFGTAIGTDLVADKVIKDYVLRKIYVIRFERHMIRVLLTYYKNNDGWILNGFKWDDDIDELFD